jgi:hypothetical protein
MSASPLLTLRPRDKLTRLADVAAVPSAYDAETFVSVLVGYLIQVGIPEPGLTRMMLDVIDELRRRDADSPTRACQKTPRRVAIAWIPGPSGPGRSGTAPWKRALVSLWCRGFLEAAAV